MTVAFVLSGGSNLGARQVGMLRALLEAGITPDLLVGASVGALNGAWVAEHVGAGESVVGLAEVWTSISRGDVFPLKFALGLRGFVGRRPSLFDSSGVRKLIETNLTFADLADATIPLVVVATDVLTGSDVAFDRGPTVDTILASAAIPGVFPPVELDGRLYIDGGVSNNAPVSHAIERGADTVYVLSSGFHDPIEHPPTSAVGMMLHALSIMVDQQLEADLEHLSDDANILVLPTDMDPPLEVGAGDFEHSADLIEGSYRRTLQWLDERSKQ